MCNSITTSALDPKQSSPKQYPDSAAPKDDNQHNVEEEKTEDVKEETNYANEENKMDQEAKEEEAEIEQLSKLTTPATAGNTKRLLKFL